MEKSQSHPTPKNMLDAGYESGLENFFKTDAVTYNHMEEEPGIKNRYFSRHSILPVIQFWPLVFEELVIAAMMLILLVTSI